MEMLIEPYIDIEVYAVCLYAYIIHDTFSFIDHIYSCTISVPLKIFSRIRNLVEIFITVIQQSLI